MINAPPTWDPLCGRVQTLRLTRGASHLEGHPYLRLLRRYLDHFLPRPRPDAPPVSAGAPGSTALQIKSPEEVAPARINQAVTVPAAACLTHQRPKVVVSARMNRSFSVPGRRGICRTTTPANSHSTSLPLRNPESPHMGCWVAHRRRRRRRGGRCSQCTRHYNTLTLALVFLALTCLSWQSQCLCAANPIWHPDTLASP